MAKKDIGLWSAISIGVGGMVGAGIFSMSRTKKREKKLPYTQGFLALIRNLTLTDR